MSRPTRAELLAWAAACFRSAGAAHDAVRCYEGAGDFAAAARLHEHAGRLADAARCYGSADEWAAAAACYRRLGRPADAADCLVRANDKLTAAWVLAEEAGHFAHARELARDDAMAQTRTFESGRMQDRVFEQAYELVLARCDLGAHNPDAAARRLDRVIDAVGELRPERRRDQVVEWAITLADRLGRPDLGGLFHAACHAARIPGAARRWEEWSLRVLGDAAGVPLDDDPTPPQPTEIPTPPG